MVRQAQTEWTDYITPDGVTYDLSVPSRVGRWVISDSGWGTPPIDYITARGPLQHGETVKAFFLRPRTIQLLVRQTYCDRITYWAGRAGLLDHIRPNRQSAANGVTPGRLVKYLPNQSQRALDVFLTDGPRFEPRSTNQWDEWAFQEVLRFVAHDPLVYDAVQQGAVFLETLAAHLTFPITFPIEFGTGMFGVTLPITYPGTWESFPIIVITGPLNHPIITNQTTGHILDMTYNLTPGEVVTINLRYGRKTIVNNLGTNLIGTLTSASDLAEFSIVPDPLAAGGVNNIRVDGSAADTFVTSVVFYFYHRFFGI